MPLGIQKQFWIQSAIRMMCHNKRGVPMPLGTQSETVLGSKCNPYGSTWTTTANICLPVSVSVPVSVSPYVLM